MGWDPWEPYQYLSPDDKVRGLEIELISAIASNAGCAVTFVQNDWMNLLKGIRDGSVDMLGGASKTAAREEFSLFSDPYRKESFVLYVRTEQLESYAGKSLEDLLDEKFRLGVTEDYIYGDEISKLQDNENYQSQIISVPISEVNYYNLTQQQVDGFLEDPFVATYTVKRKGLVSQISATSITVESGDVALMFSKKSVKPAVVEAFNKGLAALKSSGEYRKILDKYSK
jgi:polar amino acid transport system substrate-binding protein